MGFVPDNSHAKNAYAAGSLWRPGSACQPNPSTMFPEPQKKTALARPSAGFSVGWREELQAQRTRKDRSGMTRMEMSQRRLERKIVNQELECLSRNQRWHAILPRQQLDWQRHVSGGQQRHEQHRFNSALAHNAAKRPPDQQVETRNPPTMVVAGRMDGRGCAWFHPRPDDPLPPFAAPRAPPFAIDCVRSAMMKPLPKITTRLPA